MQWTMDGIFQQALNLNFVLTNAPPGQQGRILAKEGFAILNKMEEGLRRFENELSSYPPELIKEVRALQNIYNGQGIANGNISLLDGANHFINSDLEGCGKRGLAIVSRHIYPLPFPNAGFYENPSDKTKFEVVPEQPLEQQQSQKKIKPLTKDEVKRAKWIIKMKKLKYKGSPITDGTIAQFFNDPESFSIEFRPDPAFDLLTTKQGVSKALKKYFNSLNPKPTDN